ncbi:MAG: hypothetical protein IPJ22_06095 [Bacteroidetes bacterium]|nr:hypothetical protein [Bacteroidota bacterium]
MFLTFAIFKYFDFIIKDLFTASIISWFFIVSTISFFVIFKNSMKKILLVLLLIPFIVFNIFSLNVDQPIFEQELDEINKITVTKDGFLECGEIIYISQSKLGIFDKKVFQFNNLCLKGINKIETVKFDEKHAEFLIYHDGEYDSENPYKFEVERKNKW